MSQSEPWLPGTREDWLAGFAGALIANAKENQRIVLELASGDGRVTRALSHIEGIKKIVCIEGRESNIAEAQKQAYPVEVVWYQHDLEDSSWMDIFRPCGSVPALFVHVGLLYHLTNPLSHLHDVCYHAPRLLLDTHYARSNHPVKRNENQTAARAGLRDYSVWLPKDHILDALRAWFPHVEILNDREERHGPRMTVVGY